MSRSNTVSVGSFNVESGKLAVSDPCYDPPTEESGLSTVVHAKKGLWKAEVVTQDEFDWGTRVAELRVLHASVEALPVYWEREDVTLGVDSGQMAFVDLPKFEGDTRDFPPGGKMIGGEWYFNVCDSHDEGGGILDGGVVSSTGFGDGVYRLFVHRDDDGLVVAARIIFIEHNDSPPDAFDDVWPDEDGDFDSDEEFLDTLDGLRDEEEK